MRLHRIALGAVVAATLALTGCGATKDQCAGDSSATSGGSAAPATGLQYMVPNAPGGGYDTTARAAAQVMEKEGITGTVQVFNLPGAGGTVGLQRVVNEEGNGKLAVQMGLGVVGAAYTQTYRWRSAGPSSCRGRRSGSTRTASSPPVPDVPTSTNRSLGVHQPSYPE